MCYDIGIVLDDITLNASETRYNSSKCYIKNRKLLDENTFYAVVVSEAESIDILKS